MYMCSCSCGLQSLLSLVPCAGHAVPQTGPPVCVVTAGFAATQPGTAAAGGVSEAVQGLLQDDGWGRRERERRLRKWLRVYVHAIVILFNALAFIFQAFSDLCIHLGTLLGSRDMVSTASHFYRIAKWGKILREYQVN